MAWNPNLPPTNAHLLSQPVRENFQALDSLMKGPGGTAFPLYAPSGTATAPSYSFDGHPKVGMSLFAVDPNPGLMFLTQASADLGSLFFMWSTPTELQFGAFLSGALNYNLIAQPSELRLVTGSPTIRLKPSGEPGVESPSAIVGQTTVGLGFELIDPTLPALAPKLGMGLNSAAYLPLLATGPVPPSGYVSLYAKTDKKYYQKDDAGLESAIGLANPMTGVGDLIRGGAAGEPTRLAPGTNGHILTLAGGVPAWQAAPISPGFANPMTALGDLIAGGAAGLPSRLAAGANTQVLTMVAGVPAWAAPSGGGGGMTNPMTTPADLIVGGAAGAPARLGVGANTQVLTVVGGALAWQAPVSGGMTNPMSASGDVIYGGVSGAPSRLAKGSDTQVLTLVAGLPAWQTPVSGGMTNPMTTIGDVIIGGTSGAPTRLAAGATGRVLTVVAGAPAWSVPAGPTFPLLGPDGTPAVPTYSFASLSNFGIYLDASVGISFSQAGGTKASFSNTNLALLNGTVLSFSGTNYAATDTYLMRDAGGVLAIRNAANPNSLRIYGDVSNGVLLELLGHPTSGSFIQASSAAGSPLALSVSNIANAPIYFSTNNTQRWAVLATGELVPASTNTITLGVPSFRIKDLYLGTSLNFAIPSVPPTPAAGSAILYQKADKKPYWKDDAGLETALGGGTGMTNPMTATGDIIYGGASGVATRLAAGANGLVLKLAAGIPAWSADIGFANPMTAAGDVIVGGVSGTPGRLAVGSNGMWLTLAAGTPAWASLPVDPGFANPMTASGDVIYGAASGAPTRLAKGADGTVLKLAAGLPAWSADVGFANPMTTTQDLIVGGASGVAGRLAVGAARTTLVVNYQGTVTWESGTRITEVRDLEGAVTALGGTLALTASGALFNLGTYRTALSATLNLATSGPAANGRDQSAAFADGWVYVYWIWNPATTTVATTASASGTAPVLPSGYTEYCLATVLRAGTSNTWAYDADVCGNNVFYRDRTQVQAITNGTSTTEELQVLALWVPPYTVSKTAYLYSMVNAFHSSASTFYVATRVVAGKDYSQQPVTTPAGGGNADNTIQLAFPNTNNTLRWLWNAAPGFPKYNVTVMGYSVENSGA